MEAVADGADALGMAGGDGSLATVAAVAAAHGLPFVCVPAGTRNHFAMDLGVDRRDVAGALDAFTDGVERLIDVGEVNGRIFLNNVSLGIYGEAVQLAGYRDTKVRTLAETAQPCACPHRPDPGAAPHRRHGPRARTARGRACLQQRLCADRARPRAPDPRSPAVSWESWCSTHQTRCHTRRAEHGALHACRSRPPATVHAGIDGEAVELVAPLEFAVRPAALRVRISGAPSGSVTVSPGRVLAHHTAHSVEGLWQRRSSQRLTEHLRAALMLRTSAPQRSAHTCRKPESVRAPDWACTLLRLTISSVVHRTYKWTRTEPNASTVSRPTSGRCAPIRTKRACEKSMAEDPREIPELPSEQMIDRLVSLLDPYQAHHPTQVLRHRQPAR